MDRQASIVYAFLSAAIASGAIGCTNFSEGKSGQSSAMTSDPVTEEAREICEFGSGGVEEGLQFARAKREQLKASEPNANTDVYSKSSQALEDYTEELQTLSETYDESCSAYRRCQIQSSRTEGVSCEKEQENYNTIRDRVNTLHGQVLLLEPVQ